MTDFCGLYMDKLAKLSPLLSREEEVSLAKRIQKKKGGKLTPDGEEAVWQLVSANTRWAIFLAKRFSGTALPLEDAIQEAILGLYSAAIRFKPNKHGTRYTTYAYFWCMSHLLKAKDQDCILKVSRHALSAREKKMRGEELDFQEEEALDEASGALELSSLSDELTLVEKSVEEPEEDDGLCQLLFPALGRLPKRLRKVLVMRYGLDGKKAMTLAEIGQKMGLTKQRVSQLSAKAEEMLTRRLVELRGRPPCLAAS